VNVSRLALRLHKLPAEIKKGISYPEYCDLLEVIRADEQLDKVRNRA
jgi:hypothetical protein